VIATLAKQDRPSAVLYASDHGENLLDDQEQLLGHAFGNQYDLSTVGLIWLSKSLRKKLPAMTQNAVAHAHASLSLSNISHSVLDLAGVEATGLDRRLSIFSSDFTTSQRSYIVRGTLRSENSWAKFSNSPTVVRASQVFAPLDQKLGW
jgi:heptose-I-phosphate ethanolaminephosphotransferase